MAVISEIPLDSLQLGEVFLTGKGAKQIPLSIANEPVLWQPNEWLTIPWTPSAFNNPEANRVNLVFNATPGSADVTSLHALDEWSINILSEKSEKLFGKAITKEQMRSRFQPSVKTHEASGMQTWRCKMNTVGKGATRLWDTFRNPIPSPVDCWTQCTAKCVVKVKGYWMMGQNEIGLILEATNVMLNTTAAECPFE